MDHPKPSVEESLFEKAPVVELNMTGEYCLHDKHHLPTSTPPTTAASQVQESNPQKHGDGWQGWAPSNGLASLKVALVSGQYANYLSPPLQTYGCGFLSGCLSGYRSCFGLFVKGTKKLNQLLQIINVFCSFLSICAISRLRATFRVFRAVLLVTIVFRVFSTFCDFSTFRVFFW